MKQQNQIRLLIISCVVILAGLISIQYYLIENTYQLTSKTFISDVKKEITPVVDSPEMDSIESRLIEDVKLLSLQKVNDSLTLKEFNTELHKIANAGQMQSQDFLKSQFTDYPILQEIKVRTKVVQIVFETNTIYDTLLKLTDEPIVLLGENFKGKALTINTGVTESVIQKEPDSMQKPVNYFYKHNQVTDIDISNFQMKIWKKMAWTLSAAITLILSVIFLFFWMYRALIKQRKIAAIKTDFANNISHELKTPVTSLSLVVKSLKIDEINQNPQQLNALIETLERQTNRIQNVTEKVLESEIDYNIDFQKSDIIPFLKSIMSDFKPDKNSTKSEIEPESLIIKTDYHLLERVIQNLLENAKKYSPASSEIKLKSYVSGSEFMIEIADHGMGISIKEQQKIFEKFYRISEGNRHDIKGLGLGLYLSQKMMTSIGGSISVKSKIGEGSIFILKIPII